MTSLLNKYRSDEAGQSLLDRYKSKGQDDIGLDVAKQAGVGFAQGALGSYGSILEATGLNPEANLLPSQEISAKRESEQPPEKLVENVSDDISPEGSGRLPTQEDIESFIKLLGVDTEAKTSAGKIVKKGAQSTGGALSFGAGPLTTLLATAGGASGEAIREAGGPDWLATVVDLGISLSDIIKNGAKAFFTKTTKKKPSGLSERKFEDLEKPTRVTVGTKQGALEATEKEFREIREGIQQSTNKSLKSFREDPEFEGKLSEAFKKLDESASKVEGTVSASVYKKNLADEYAKIGKKGFEKSESEKKLSKLINDSIKNSTGKEFTLTELIDQFRKNNKEIKKYAPFGPSAIENEAQRELLLIKNKSIAKNIESHFSDVPEAKEFKFLNEKWSEVQKIKTIDSYVDSIFKGDKIDFTKAKEALAGGKQSRNLENALGKGQFKEFKQLVNDLVDQEKGMKLLKANGYTLDDLSEHGKALLLKPALGKAKIAYEYVSRIWRQGLADPKFTRDWSKAVSLFNAGKVPQALEIINKLSVKDEED